MGEATLMKISAKELYNFKDTNNNFIRSRWNPLIDGKYLLFGFDIFSYFTAFSLAYLIRLPSTTIDSLLFHSSHVPIFLFLVAFMQIFDTYNTRDDQGIFSLASKNLLASTIIIPFIFIQDYLFGTYEVNFISGRGIALLFGSSFVVLTT